MTVCTIFAQAHELGPFLDPEALSNGDYRSTDDLLNGIAFTDVGAASLESIQGMGTWGSIKGTKVDSGPFRWDVILKTEGLSVTMKAKLLHEDKESAESLAIAFHLDGDPLVMSQFCRGIFQNLGRSPMDGIDWETLEGITNKPKEDMLGQWGELIMPEPPDEGSDDGNGPSEERVGVSDSTHLGGKEKEGRARGPSAVESARKKLEEKKQISIHINTGSKLYRDNRYEEAIEEWEKILAIDPNHEKTREAISFAKQRLDVPKKEVARPPKKRILIKRNCPKCSEPLKVRAIKGQPARFQCLSCGFKGAFKPRSKRMKRVVKPSREVIARPPVPPVETKVRAPEPVTPPTTEIPPTPAHEIAPPSQDEPSPAPEPEPIPEPPMETPQPPPEQEPEPQPSIETPPPMPESRPEPEPPQETRKEKPKKRRRLRRLKKRVEKPSVVRLELDAKPKAKEEPADIPPKPEEEVKSDHDSVSLEDEIPSPEPKAEVDAIPDEPSIPDEPAIPDEPMMEEAQKEVPKTKVDWDQEQAHIKDEIHDLMSSLQKDIPDDEQKAEPPSELFDGLDDLVSEDQVDEAPRAPEPETPSGVEPPIIEDEPEEPLPKEPPSIETIDELYNTAKRLGDGGLYYEALKYLDRILAVDPEHAKTLNDKGIVLWNIGDAAGALKYYEKTLKVDPGSIEALVNMGVALGKMGNKEQALTSYDEALDLDSGCFEAWLSKGSTLFSLDRYSDAADCFSKASEIESKNPEGWFGLGFTKEKLGEYESALTSYDEVLKLDPSNVDALRGREICLKEVRRDMLKNWLQ